MVIEAIGETQNKIIIEPKFRDSAIMTHEELTDPDYHLKQLVRLSGGKVTITCSRCHHCR